MELKLNNLLNYNLWLTLITNEICTIDEVVIADSTRLDLFPWFCTIQRFATCNAIQIKERSYHDQHPIDKFLILMIEVFECLHK
jgi:hypothetical protein